MKMRLTYGASGMCSSQVKNERGGWNVVQNFVRIEANAGRSQRAAPSYWGWGVTLTHTSVYDPALTAPPEQPQIHAGPCTYTTIKSKLAKRPKRKTIPEI